MSTVWFSVLKKCGCYTRACVGVLREAVLGSRDRADFLRGLKETFAAIGLCRCHHDAIGEFREEQEAADKQVDGSHLCD